MKSRRFPGVRVSVSFTSHPMDVIQPRVSPLDLGTRRYKSSSVPHVQKGMNDEWIWNYVFRLVLSSLYPLASFSHPFGRARVYVLYSPVCLIIIIAAVWIMTTYCGTTEHQPTQNTFRRKRRNNNSCTRNDALSGRSYHDDPADFPYPLFQLAPVSLPHSGL